jgi:hypothetical protein
VLIALQTWGNRHFAPEGLSVMLVDARTGAAAEPILVDRLTGTPITDTTHKNAAGPAAGAGVKKRLGARRSAAQMAPALSAAGNAKPARRAPPGSKS